MPDPNSLVCVVAHPDDETRLGGAVLALLAQRGVAVHLVALTRGEGGELGEPPLATRATIGALRERELACAAQALGARTLEFLGYVDPVVGPDDTLYAPEAEPATLRAQIAAAIRAHGAQAVLTHGRNGEYGHPAHRLVNEAVTAAVLALPEPRPVLYTFAASFPDNPYPRLANQDDPAHFVIDARPLLDRLEAAALCHVSQHPLFVRRRSREAGRRLSVREVLAMETHAGVRRQWPAVAEGATPEDVFAGWIKRAIDSAL